MVLKIGINGFGRIGRVTYRALLEKKGAQVVAVNDLTDSKTLAHLLRYDSLYDKLPFEVKATEHSLKVNGQEIRTFWEKEPEKIPWGEMGVEVVIESTGVFRDRESAGRHLKGGASRVIVTSPMKDPDLTVVMGVNEEHFQPSKHRILSNASCTTNALAPVAKVLQRNFGVQKALINTTHAYTNDQRLLDYPHGDLRRARAAFLSLIPTSTGAARAVGEVIPELKGRIDGFAVRVPVPTVSLLDVVAILDREVSLEELNASLQQAAEESPEILSFSQEPLVSVDYRRSPYSSVIDGLSTMVVGGNMVRVVSWYDNEWSYSCRVADLALYVKKREMEEKEAVTAGDIHV
ncbi:MAG: type I glyceraldehyde-3-phosphate dehydrogenase [Dethiobacter sp.]|jgi:glyceraldehyde 3-phosphate dehydrogenase|nr:MAG: type I glyceraldehyde-3-phosphate dehydrogenase [Dethiobacter sp.]